MRSDPVSPTNRANPGSRHSAAKPGLLSPLALLVTGEPVAAVVPPRVMAAFPTARTCICLARLPCWFSLPAHPRRRHQSPDATRDCQKGMGGKPRACSSRQNVQNVFSKL